MPPFNMKTPGLWITIFFRRETYRNLRVLNLISRWLVVLLYEFYRSIHQFWRSSHVVGVDTAGVSTARRRGWHSTPWGSSRRGDGQQRINRPWNLQNWNIRPVCPTKMTKMTSTKEYWGSWRGMPRMEDFNGVSPCRSHRKLLHSTRCFQRRWMGSCGSSLPYWVLGLFGYVSCAR